MNSIDTFLLSESFMPSLTLEDVVRFSPFVARSLSAMHPGEDARACLAHFERIVEETFPREAMEAGFGLDAVSVCVDDALDALCELTGENASEAVIEQVFERFCVGK